MIADISTRYADFLKGWDAALLRAAMEFDGVEREVILSLLKSSETQRSSPEEQTK